MTTLLLWSHAGWDGGPWFLLFPLLWIGLVVWAFVSWRGRPGRGAGSAEEILAERYARGEISAEEFRQGRDVLRSKR